MIVLDQIGLHLPQGYLFSNVRFQINKSDRIGLVGKNGAGKSTLLRLISGESEPSEGAIHKPKNTQIGFLTQDIIINSEKSVFNYLNDSNERITFIRKRIVEINHDLTRREDYESEGYLALLDELNELNHEFTLIDGFQWEERITAILKGLGFSDSEMQKRLNELSGGWKMRAELAKLLVNAPDILLLDEPTNHLDIISISWLETYLKTYAGAVVLISHDRLFLDNVTNRTIEISNQKVFDYPYAYTKYKEVRDEELERLASAKKQQDKDIKHTEELINKFRAKKNKAAFAQSLIKKLEKTDIIEIENNEVSKMRLTFPLSVQPGKWVLELKDVGKSFGDKVVFKNANITVGRGEKIALLGANGKGKSTLLKRITGVLKGEGEIELGHNVNISYFAQDQAEELDQDKTVYETVDEVAKGDIRSRLRSILGAFLFGSEDVIKKVSVLSGGERTRLALCQLLLSPSNVLILDEPTNHLDLQSKEVLKNALKEYQGTFIIVSHDREFLDGLTNRIWEIDEYSLKEHFFTVKEFLQRKSEDSKINESTQSSETKVNKPVNPEKSLSYQEEKELKRRLNKLNNQIYKAEQEIEHLEKEIAGLDEQLASIDFHNDPNAAELLKNYEKKKVSLDAAMLTWEKASEEMMNLES